MRWTQNDTKTKVIYESGESEIKIFDLSCVHLQVQAINNENHNIKTINVTFMPKANSFISHYSVYICVPEIMRCELMPGRPKWFDDFWFANLLSWFFSIFFSNHNYMKWNSLMRYIRKWVTCDERCASQSRQPHTIASTLHFFSYINS